MLLKDYIKIREINPKYRFSAEDTRSLMSCNEVREFNRKHPILFGGVRPENQFEIKESDPIAVELYNEIVGYEFSIDNIEELKESSEALVEYYDKLYPSGDNMNEIEAIRYITAHSSSSFLGIQNPSKSYFAYDSMIKTLEAHSNPSFSHKPWLIKNLEFIHPHLVKNPHIFKRHYGDMVMTAKSSSSSVLRYGSFRDYAFEHTMEDVIEIAKLGVDYMYFAGTRSDRRAKYRLIFATHAVIRIMDYLINNGSYALCSHGGMLSKYTTEGYSNEQMWPQLAVMSIRGKWVMVCVDYKGYDTQIRTLDYANISYLLNKHRMGDHEFSEMFSLFMNWLLQPKPLVTRVIQEGMEKIFILLYLVVTLPSGKHGTHSFENLIGISTILEAVSRGVKLFRFWSNGDDQNALVSRETANDFIKFLQDYFVISVKKSLVGHKLAVWGKLWFAQDTHPMWEIGTFRSIWEKEGSDSSYVEESKFESNYCKILQVAITMIRLGKSESIVRYWIEKLCKQCNPNIDPDRLPVRLNNVYNTTSSTRTRPRSPKGLESVKSYLTRKNFDLRIFGANNMYAMMEGMYKNNKFFDVEVAEVLYHPPETNMIIEPGFNYSYNAPKNIPHIFEKIFRLDELNTERTFVRTVLQSSKSFDGPVNKRYYFKDMITLARSINNRNREAWKKMISSYCR